MSAYRWLRICAGLSGLDRMAGYARDGFLSSEHVDATVKGVAHVYERSHTPVTAEGRLVGKFDVAAVIGEKLFSALDLWSRARPEPDGSDDARTPTQRRPLPAYNRRTLTLAA